MPLANGDSHTGSHHLIPGKKTLDSASALKTFQKEYAKSDGIDAKTLLDSRAHGGLTYNDFLVLPGYIGMICTYIARLAV